MSVVNTSPVLSIGALISPIKNPSSPLQSNIREKYGTALNDFPTQKQEALCGLIEDLLQMLPEENVHNFFTQDLTPLTSEEKLSLYPGLRPENYAEFVKALEDNNIEKSDDAAALKLASKDKTPLPHTGTARHILFPKGHHEVAVIIKLLNQFRIPATFRAGGTNLTGCAIPLDGVVISSEKLTVTLRQDDNTLVTKPLIVSMENRSVKVAPGVPTKDLNETLRNEYNSELGFDPVCMMGASSGVNCNVGGNFIMEASGPGGMATGPTSHSVIGFNAVRGDGTPLFFQTGPQGEGPGVHKDVAGYKSANLLMGSEGTLGGVTSICLKLKEKTTRSLDVVCIFKSMKDATDAITEFNRQNIRPKKVEIMSAVCVRETVDALKGKLTLPEELSSLGTEHTAELIISIEGGDDVDPLVSAAKIQKVITEKFPSARFFADDDAHKLSTFVWDVRANLFTAVTTIAPHKSSDDVVVPLGKLADLMVWLDDIQKDLGIHITAAGHAGDGNLHIQFYHDPIHTAEELAQWKRTLELARFIVFLKVLSFDGSITGEHGVGTKKRDFLPLQLSPTVLHSQMKTKLEWDPNLILNPGVMLNQRALLALKGKVEKMEFLYQQEILREKQLAGAFIQ